MSIATTIEQSRKLIELGLDPATADMYYDNVCGDELRVGNYDIADTTRAWSLSALLEVMPSFINYKGQKLRLTAEKAGIWNVFYIGTKHRLNEIWFNGEDGKLLSAAYEMVC